MIRHTSANFRQNRDNKITHITSVTRLPNLLNTLVWGTGTQYATLISMWFEGGR